MGMKTMLDAGPRFVFLGSRKGLSRARCRRGVSFCHDRAEIDAALTSRTRRVTWISSTRHFTEMLLEKAMDSRGN